MATAAIYARKSKATEKGESIENQISRCKSLCELRDWDYIIYQDYDISGKTLDRPGFAQMMQDAEKGKFNSIVCYKLDRISRSVNDFSSLINELDNMGVSFISVKDNFDLSSPLGKAMMYMSSVFAQLERETIAERVRDNMIDRAKMGKWNGGPVPYGFDVIKETTNTNGRNKKASKLIIKNDEAEIVKQFYEWYLEFEGSIRNNVTRANSFEYSYKTKNNSTWAHNQMSRMLQNSLYCIADKTAYEYFKNHTNIQIVNSKKEFDGTYGLMFYNRRKAHKSTSRQRSKEEWILVIGEHPGIIPGEMYKKVQMKLKSNKNHAPRTGKSEKSPLVGLVRCGRCGSAMSVFSSKKSSTKEKGYFNYFRCLTREQKSKVLCDNNNVRTDVLENIIIDYIKEICNDKKFITDILESTNDELETKRVPLIAKRNKTQAAIDSLESEIQNLVNALGKGTLPEIIIQKRYRDLEKQKKDYNKQLFEIENELDSNYTETCNMDVFIKSIEEFRDTYEYLDFNDKKKLLRSIVKKVKVDKEKVTLTLYFSPQNKKDHALCLRMHKDSC
ncbi:recombinase family protein [Crassaminicella profunda]|nr:recombinase family protein [Crassaminicella profunda]QZY56661.1 recombinase family protein [Crassaminicella profunda]